MATMNHSIKVTLLGLLLAGVSIGYGQDTNSYRVLFLGNSEYYSRGGVYSPFEGFCHAAGLDYQAVSQWNRPPNPLDIEFLDFGRIPTNLPDIAADSEIHALIRNGDFDFVILAAKRPGHLLPESVELPERLGRYISYSRNIAALGAIHKTIVESEAQTVLYIQPEWHMFLDTRFPIVQVYQRLHTDLEAMEIEGKLHSVILVPGLYLWEDAAKKYGVDDWYAEDGLHGSALARYASACMFYTYLTGNDPRENDFKKLTVLTREWEIIPEKIDVYATDEQAEWIKDQVWLYYSTRAK